MTKDLFDKYIWLVDTIYRAGKITFEEINERWISIVTEREVITTILRMRMICKREVSVIGCSIRLQLII